MAAPHEDGFPVVREAGVVEEGVGENEGRAEMESEGEGEGERELTDEDPGAINSSSAAVDGPETPRRKKYKKKMGLCTVDSRYAVGKNRLPLHLSAGHHSGRHMWPHPLPLSPKNGPDLRMK